MSRIDINKLNIDVMFPGVEIIKYDLSKYNMETDFEYHNALIKLNNKRLIFSYEKLKKLGMEDQTRYIMPLNNYIYQNKGFIIKDCSDKINYEYAGMCNMACLTVKNGRDKGRTFFYYPENVHEEGPYENFEIDCYYALKYKMYSFMLMRYLNIAWDIEMKLMLNGGKKVFEKLYMGCTNDQVKLENLKLLADEQRFLGKVNNIIYLRKRI